MKVPISEVAKVISQVLSIIKPEVSEKILKALEEIGKDDEKEKQEFLEALRSGDADIINQLINRKLSGV